MRDYDLSERAKRDVAAAIDWYAQVSDHLANEFFDDFLLALRVARERPMSCPQFRDEVRTLRCRRFPYRVYFVPLEERIDVLAVYHTARNPDLWDDPGRE